MTIESSENLLALVFEAANHLNGADAGLWLDKLQEVHQSLLSLVDRLVADQDAEQALMALGVLAQFWWMRGLMQGARSRAARVLAVEGGSTQARTQALLGTGSLDYAAGDFASAFEHYEQALTLMGDETLQRATALNRAGMAARQRMMLKDAQQLHIQALDIQKKLDAPAVDIALSLNNLGVIAFFSGNFEAAYTLHQEALALREQTGDLRGQASSLNNLGQTARLQKNYIEAKALMLRALSLREQLHDSWGVSGSHVCLACACVMLGETGHAKYHLKAAIEGFIRVSDPLGICECLDAAIEIFHTEGRHHEARQIWHLANAYRVKHQTPRPPVLNQFIEALFSQMPASQEELPPKTDQSIFDCAQALVRSLESLETLAQLTSPDAGWTFERSTRLVVNAGELWTHITSMDGVNAELWPWLRMTFPSASNILSPQRIDPPGVYLFDSWLLLLGIIPIDRHSLSLQAMVPPKRFYEVSKSWLQRQWIHDREISALPEGGCILRDSVAFTPKLQIFKPLIAVAVRSLFAWRHRRLRARFG